MGKSSGLDLEWEDKQMSRASVKASVRVCLEFPLTDTWGQECTVSQVVEQSTRIAREQIVKKLEGLGVSVLDTNVSVRLAEVK